MSHFYLPDGTPFYQVPYAGKREGLRDATIRDARKVGAYPSVTAIIDVAAKPGLVNWKIEQSILAALTNPHIRPDMGVREIMTILKRDANEQAKAAAERGTAIHDAIEAWYRGDVVPHEWWDCVDPVQCCIKEHCGDQEWQAEKWFASPMGYGGKIDLISDDWVLDIKTKEGDVSEITAWPEQAMQLVAYDIGEALHGHDPNMVWVTQPTRRLANVFVSRDIPGSVKFVEWQDREQLRKYWSMFRALLAYWHESNGYFPHLEPDDA